MLGIISVIKAISACASSEKRMRLWTFTDAFGSFKRFRCVVKATFHLTISMRGQRATGKIQRNNYHHESCGVSLTGKTMSVFLIFTHGMHRNVKNCWVRSSLRGWFIHIRQPNTAEAKVEHLFIDDYFLWLFSLKDHRVEDTTASEGIRTVAATYGCKILQLYEYDANVYR